jgi:hypothetical protein
MIRTLALGVAAAGLAAQSTIDATKIALSPPSAIVEIDTGKLKGDLVRLAISPDGTQFYLQTVERDSRGNVVARHYLLGTGGEQPKGTGQEPRWAAEYWTGKAAQSAPGLSSFKIAIDQQQKRVTSTSTPAGGDMAKGGLGPGTGGAGGGVGGTSVAEATGAALQSQYASVITMTLKGEVVGQFVNAPALPGTTFGWGPAGSGLIVFTSTEGRLVIMDDQGRKQEIPGSKAAQIPGWTADGARLVYLERTGRKRLTLKAITVTLPRS